MPKPTKRYWVDWETASTRVEDGWSLEAEEPTGPRVTQREFVRQNEPAAPPQPPRGASPPARDGVALEERRTSPRRRQSSHADAGAGPVEPGRSAPDRASAPEAPPASHGAGRAVSQPPHGRPGEPDASATVGRLPRQQERGDAQEPVNAGATHSGERHGSEGGALVHANAPPTIAVATHNFVQEFARDPRLVLVREPDSEQAAAYRVLRHHVVQQGNPHVIVVSSARRGERKTTCAVNLALALGECRRARVLLVDAHFRRPQLAAIFRFQPPKCFAEQLAAHRDRPMEEWSVVEIAPHGLHVVAASPRQEPLFDAPAFAYAMERLRMAGYDHIVIDAPPVLGTAEVNLLQDAADGVLLTTLAGRSRRRDLRAAVEQLTPASILGVALLKG